MSDAAPPALAFVHVPKNAGTALTRKIRDRQLPILVSDHSYPRRLAANEFLVLRCPIARFASAFRYGRKRWPNAVNASFDSADELARSAGDPSHPKHETAWNELGNRPGDFLLRNGKQTPVHTVAGEVLTTNWVYAPQSSWLRHDGLRVLRYRHLDSDFAALLASFGLPGVGALERHNVGEPDEPIRSEAALAFLGQLYAADLAYIRAHGLEV